MIKNDVDDKFAVMKSSGGLVRDSVITTIFSVLSRGIGFIVPIVIAAFFGASRTTDAFYFANTIPTFLINVFVIAFGAVLVPYLTNKWVNQPDKVEPLLGNIYLFFIILSILVIGLLILGIPLAIPYLTSGMKSADVTLTVRLSILLLPMIIFSTLVGLTSAVLNSQRHYSYPALAPGIRALIALVVILVLHGSLEIYSVVLGYLLGELFTFIILYRVQQRKGILPIYNQREFKFIIEILVSTLPLILAMVATQFNTVIARIMAAPLGEGSLSVLDYADKVVVIPITLISTGVLVVLLTHWSTLVAGNRKSELNHSIQKAISSIIFIALPLSLFLSLLRQPIIKLLYERGAFGISDTVITANVMGIIAIGITPNLLGSIFGRVHLAFQNTKLFLVISIVKLIITYGLIKYLAPGLGIIGIALALVLPYLISVPMFWLASLPLVGNVFDLRLLGQIVRICLVSGLAYAGGSMMLYLTNSSPYIELFIVSIICIPIYLMAAKALNVTEANIAINYIRTKSRQFLRPSNIVSGIGEKK